jgi:RimJ/RimL family protein N-acetyltransferase
MSKVSLVGLNTNEQRLLKLAEWRNHKEVRGILLTPYVTANDFEKQKEWADSTIKSESNHFYYIEPIDNYQGTLPGNEIVGYCGLIHLKMIPRTAELSVLIGPEYMGKGFGKDAVIDLLDIAFFEFNLNCVYVDCYTNSDRWDFFKKIGFVYEGKLRDRKYWKGCYYDSIIGSVLRDDWVVS